MSDLVPTPRRARTRTHYEFAYDGLRDGFHMSGYGSEQIPVAHNEETAIAYLRYLLLAYPSRKYVNLKLYKVTTTESLEEVGLSYGDSLE
jgi:hypothetical protein